MVSGLEDFDLEDSHCESLGYNVSRLEYRATYANAKRQARLCFRNPVQHPEHRFILDRVLCTNLEGIETDDATFILLRERELRQGRENVSTPGMQ